MPYRVGSPARPTLYLPCTMIRRRLYRVSLQGKLDMTLGSGFPAGQKSQHHAVYAMAAAVSRRVTLGVGPAGGESVQGSQSAFFGKNYRVAQPSRGLTGPAAGRQVRIGGAGSQPLGSATQAWHLGRGPGRVPGQRLPKVAKSAGWLRPFQGRAVF